MDFHFYRFSVLDSGIGNFQYLSADYVWKLWLTLKLKLQVLVNLQVFWWYNSANFSKMPILHFYIQHYITFYTVHQREKVKMLICKKKVYMDLYLNISASRILIIIIFGIVYSKNISYANTNLKNWAWKRLVKLYSCTTLTFFNIFSSAQWD